MTRLIQLQHGPLRCVAVVQEPSVRVLHGFDSILALAADAIQSNTPLTSLIQNNATDRLFDYDPIYRGQSEWRLLPAIDHPLEAARCLVSGTGLTHLGSAKNRNAMHEANDSELTDSMKMFKWGLEAGKPPPGRIGVAPEWFYKGPGSILRAHGQPLIVPAFSDDGGEEAEIAGVYLIDADGQPRRIGMANGNEFADHKFEKKNYLNLAGSKIRNCSLGPELVIDPEFQSVPGKVVIERAGREFWSRDILTGEMEMCHSLANIEHHHFKFQEHRRPGDLHVHYFGACSLSFGAGVELADGDIMDISFAGFGRPLRNPLRVLREEVLLVRARPLS
jgi:hypothetical protein